MTQVTLEAMIGQLFIIGFKGDHITAKDVIAEDIVKRSLGGVILFDRHLASKSKANNITGPEQLLELTTALQGLRPEKLFIAVDQEGGRVSRFRSEFGFSESLSAAELGRDHTAGRTKNCSEQVATMLKQCGVNLNFSPVVDLNSNPENPIVGRVERSFSSKADEVVNHAKAWVKPHRQMGIASCLKHFPGHGSSQSDSHLGFVDISNTWDQSELEPYRQLIDLDLADMVMVGHLYNRTIDKEYPATLSEKTVTGLLRQDLGYDGLVITDDMQMKAITYKYGLQEACILAINAGVDQIIIGNNLEYNPEILTSVQNAVAHAVDNGTLSETRIRQAYSRVQKLKSNIA